MDKFNHQVDTNVICDNSPIIFKWHWPRGILGKRMSALELATFILPHMPHIIPLMANNPIVQAEFTNLFIKVAGAPDEIVPWIKSVIRTEEDDIIELAVGAKVTETGPTYFVLN